MPSVGAARPASESSPGGPSSVGPIPPRRGVPLSAASYRRAAFRCPLRPLPHRTPRAFAFVPPLGFPALVGHGQSNAQVLAPDYGGARPEFPPVVEAIFDRRGIPRVRRSARERGRPPRSPRDSGRAIRERSGLTPLFGVASNSSSQRSPSDLREARRGLGSGPPGGDADFLGHCRSRRPSGVLGQGPRPAELDSIGVRHQSPARPSIPEAHLQ